LLILFWRCSDHGAAKALCPRCPDRDRPARLSAEAKVDAVGTEADILSVGASSKKASRVKSRQGDRL
ncbi:hypothetical protein, partial [Fulvivirga imtechensis]|uniref:hypothetical protein n=1 Tax=Fulvivirga imtechensis TaxID=881893 RepID=UPI00058B1D53